MPKGLQQKSHVTTSPLPAPPVLGETNEKPPFKTRTSGKQPSFHLFPGCAKSTLTGFDPKQGQLRTPRFCSLRRPPPSTFNFNYVGTGPGWGLPPDSPGPVEEAPCCGPESFLKVYTGPLGCCQCCTFSLARFLALLGHSQAKALSCSFFFLYAGISSPWGPTAPHSCK